MRDMWLFRAVVLASLPALHAHDVVTTKLTWSREVSRIVQARCLSCHQEGGAAMSLATYAEARPWAKAIKEQVLTRKMPPWGAVKGFGAFQHDRSLSQEEINLIAAWVEGGAPEGDPAHLPAMTASTVAVTAPPSRAVAVAPGVPLSRPMTVVGIVPKAATTKTRVTARRPEGSVEPLLWLQDYTPGPASPAAYYYARPLHLPRGTVLEVEGKPVAVELLTSRR